MSLVRFRLWAPHAGTAQSLAACRLTNAACPTCGHSSSGRAPPCQGGGSEFEPRCPPQRRKKPAPFRARLWRKRQSTGFFLLSSQKRQAAFAGAPRSRAKEFAVFQTGIRQRSQVVRQRSAKSPPPVRVWALPPDQIRTMPILVWFFFCRRTVVKERILEKEGSIWNIFWRL